MTDHDQCAFEEALRVDLAAARQEVMLLKDQLSSANTANEALSYKVDFLTKEVSRVTASREQYERISIRVSTFAESIGNVAIQQLQSLMDEIKAAAFTKVPGEVKPVPWAIPEDTGTASSIDSPVPSKDDFEIAFKRSFKIDSVAAAWINESPNKVSIGVTGVATSPDMAVLEQIGRNFGAGFSSASLLPLARLGNGAVKS